MKENMDLAGNVTITSCATRRNEARYDTGVIYIYIIQDPDGKSKIILLSGFS